MTKLTFNGVNDDNQRAGIELELPNNSSGKDVLPVAVSDGKANLTPSNYTGITSVLTTGGTGHALESNVTKIELGLAVANAGPVLLAFGTSSADAVTNVEGGGTASSWLGMMVKFPVGAAIGEVSKIIEVPNDDTITHFAIAEGHATPTCQLVITQGI